MMPGGISCLWKKWSLEQIFLGTKGSTRITVIDK